MSNWKGSLRRGTRAPARGGDRGSRPSPGAPPSGWCPCSRRRRWWRPSSEPGESVSAPDTYAETKETTMTQKKSKQNPAGSVAKTFAEGLLKGKATPREIKAFQKKNGLEPTGVLDAATISLIKSHEKE